MTEVRENRLLPPWRTRLRGGFLGVAVALAAGAAAALLVVSRLETLRLNAADILARSSLENGKSASVVVVEIDEGTLAALGPDYGRMNEWPREFYGMVLNALRTCGARSVAFDILFDAPSPFDPGSDAAFAAAVGKAPDVVLAANFIEGGAVDKTLPGELARRFAVPAEISGTPDAFPEYPVVITAFNELLAAAAGIGSVRLEADPDGVLRRIHPFYRHQGHLFASFGLAAIRGTEWSAVEVSGNAVALTRPDGSRIPLPVENDGLLRLRFLGGRERYLGPSFAQMLGVAAGIQEGLPIPEELADAVRNKYVLIGVSAAGLYDLKVTPVDRWLPGVYVNATAAENVILNRWLIRSSEKTVLAVSLLLALAGGLAVRMKRWYLGVAAAAALALLLFLSARFAFACDRWFDPAAPFAALWLGFTAAGVHRYLTEDYYKRKIRSAWGRYLSPEVIDELSKRDFELEGLERGVRRELTILFSDIVGFTAMSERLSPEEVVHQLNEYLGVMSDVIRRNNGTLDKYIGDAIMAFWGEPLEDPGHAVNAVNAALDMVDALSRLRERWLAEGKKPFGIGIGVNTGHVVVGHFGGAHRNYTVIGDEVNVASRLEGLTRDFNAEILVSAATAERVKDFVELRHIGEVKVKNRENPVDVYAVVRRKRDEGAAK
ncbi:MAG TPA: adenylate/guanylate cyclase domain-containing protein [Planctomycetes bacterium]|nr:adenylate/guanylate cyclase domain-containing protein [Planctomycetota bacterium]